MDSIGVDEVGRGAWAGPVCVGAVQLHAPVLGLKDSKMLSKSQRYKLAQVIRRHGTVGLGWANRAEIDTLGLTAALSLAFSRALRFFEGQSSQIIMDGSYNFLPGRKNVTVLIKADMTEASVSAASIVAKVARDNMMNSLALRHPQYGFERHVGYGTVLHRQALQKHGPCNLHRLSFTPIRNLSIL